MHPTIFPRRHRFRKMARLLLFILFCGGTLREHFAFSPTPSFRHVTSLRALDVEESIETNAEGSPLVRRDYDTFLWKDYKINYRVEGEGEPILLVHGFGGNVNHFRFQFPALVEAGYQVYAIDLLGFGASDKPGDAPYSIELFVELIVDFVTHMSAESKGQKWVLCGNSIGSLSALGAAEQLSDLVKAMVMFNCAGGMSMFRYVARHQHSSNGGCETGQLTSFVMHADMKMFHSTSVPSYGWFKRSCWVRNSAQCTFPTLKHEKMCSRF